MNSRVLMLRCAYTAMQKKKREKHLFSCFVQTFPETMQNARASQGSSVSVSEIMCVLSHFLLLSVASPIPFNSTPPWSTTPPRSSAS